MVISDQLFIFTAHSSQCIVNSESYLSHACYNKLLNRNFGTYPILIYLFRQFVFSWDNNNTSIISPLFKYFCKNVGITRRYRARMIYLHCEWCASVFILRYHLWLLCLLLLHLPRQASKVRADLPLHYIGGEMKMANSFTMSVLFVPGSSAKYRRLLPPLLWFHRSRYESVLRAKI